MQVGLRDGQLQRAARRGGAADSCVGAAGSAADASDRAAAAATLNNRLALMTPSFEMMT